MIHFKPIGYFKTDFTPQTRAPRQGRLTPQAKGTIILEKEYIKALRDLDKFEYIYILFFFDKVKDWESIVKPPVSNRTYGLFATRTPRRPNPIGMTLVKLESIENNRLLVSGVDAFDGTPVLDIKPFFPDLDCVETKQIH